MDAPGTPSSPPPALPTLRDVARLAGTSVPTASKVLAGRSDVSEATRLAVLAAVAKVGYVRPSGRRTHTLPSDSRTIELVVNGIDGGWTTRVLMGIEAAAAEADLAVVVTAAHEGDEGWVRRVTSRMSAGVILAVVPSSQQQLAAFAARGTPVVVIDPENDQPTTTARVGAANWDGGRTAAEHLLSRGHRRFGVIAGSKRHQFSQARADGFRSAVESAGGTPAPQMVRHADWNTERAEACAGELLDSATPPTAVFACSDGMALGVYRACEARGLSIPSHVSVVGFDGLPQTQWMNPRLTTVAQPLVQMGAAAVRLVLSGVTPGTSGPENPAPWEQLATTLLVRDSTAQLTPH